MKRKSAICRTVGFSMLSAVLFISCATSSKTIRGMHPANVDMQGTKSISVQQFTIDFESEINSSEPLIVSGAERACVYLHSCITKDLKDSEYLKLRNSKADALLSGVISDFSYETVAEPSGAGYMHKVYMTVTYEIVSQKNQQVLASRRAAISAVSETEKTKELLPPVYDIIEPHIPRLSATILKDLQPYPVVRRISLIKPKFDFTMQTAYMLFKKGEYTRAKNAYLQAYNEKGTFEAGYNAARIMQIKGELSEAKLLVTDLFKKYKDKRAADVLHEIEEEQANAAHNKN